MKELIEGSVIKHSPWAGTEPNSRISPLPCLSKVVSEGSIVEVLPYLRGDWSPGEGFFLLILILPCYNLSPLTIVMYTSKAEATMALLGHIKLLICQFGSTAVSLLLCSLFLCIGLLLTEYRILYLLCSKLWSLVIFYSINVTHTIGNKRSWMKNIFVTLLQSKSRFKYINIYNIYKNTNKYKNLDLNTFVRPC